MSSVTKFEQIIHLLNLLVVFSIPSSISVPYPLRFNLNLSYPEPFHAPLTLWRKSKYYNVVNAPFTATLTLVTLSFACDSSYSFSA